MSFLLRIFLVLLLSVVVPLSAQAQYGYGKNRSGASGGTSGGASGGRVWRDNPREARQIAGWVDDAWDLCRTLPDSYQTDCLAGEYRTIAARLPRNGAFTAQTKAALDLAVRGLEAAARPARDRSQPRIRANVPRRRGVPARQTASIEPVRVEAAAQVNIRAAQAITAAGAQLLRSVPDDDPRAASFKRIAAAFGDTAVLLRS